MLATSKGRLIALTTPAGKRGWFFESWTTGGDNWHRVRVPASDCPRISPEFLAEELRELGAMRFTEEYGLEFRDSLEAAFPETVIRNAFSTRGAAAMGMIEWRKVPATFKERWVVGVDLGQSADPTAISVLHKKTLPLDTWTHDEIARVHRQEKKGNFRGSPFGTIGAWPGIP